MFHIMLNLNMSVGAAKTASNAFVEKSSGTIFQISSARKNWKRYGKTKRLEKDPLRLRRNQIPISENSFSSRETRTK